MRFEREPTLPAGDNVELDIVSTSPAETQQMGSLFGETAEPGDLICLEGDLGSGKTAFVQGIGKGLGIPQAIHSPTFVLANEYPGGRLVLYHLDVYRVRGVQEAMGFGLEDYIEGDGVCVIEWSEKIRAAVPPERLWIRFDYLSESERQLHLTASGLRYQTWLGELGTQLAGIDHASRH